ncbi:MAG: RT0821/Lpp0805 family surface protein [Pseudomonadota bacterium]
MSIEMAAVSQSNVKRRVTATVAAMALIGAVAGCASNGQGGGLAINKQTIGGGLGAAAGVAIGSAIGQGGGKTAAMIVGGLLGGLAGSEIGRRMDEQDQQYAYSSTQTALETQPDNTPTTWSNPNSGASGTVTPQSPYYNASNQVCRDYTHEIIVDGQAEVIRGVACRNSDGTWSPQA